MELCLSCINLSIYVSPGLNGLNHCILVNKYHETLWHGPAFYLYSWAVTQIIAFMLSLMPRLAGRLYFSRDMVPVFAQVPFVYPTGCNNTVGSPRNLNPSCSIHFSIKIYLLFLSFLKAKIAQVAKNMALFQDLVKSWSREIGSLIITSFWNLTGTLAALLPRCLSNFRAIVQF